MAAGGEIKVWVKYAKDEPKDVEDESKDDRDESETDRKYCRSISNLTANNQNDWGNDESPPALRTSLASWALGLGYRR